MRVPFLTTAWTSLSTLTATVAGSTIDLTLRFTTTLLSETRSLSLSILFRPTSPHPVSSYPLSACADLRVPIVQHRMRTPQDNMSYSSHSSSLNGHAGGSHSANGGMHGQAPWGGPFPSLHMWPIHETFAMKMIHLPDQQRVSHPTAQRSHKARKGLHHQGRSGRFIVSYADWRRSRLGDRRTSRLFQASGMPTLTRKSCRGHTPRYGRAGER